MDEKRSQHYIIYTGFLFLAGGKLIEALNIVDPKFKILKISACACIYILVSLHLIYGVRSIIYILIPLGVYYALHYRLMFQQKRT